MALTNAAIAQQLQQLLPRGAAWSRSLQGNLYKLLLAAADELLRIYNRGADLLRQAHPATIDELLPEWERELDLPGRCVTEPQTDDERRAAIASRLNQVGGQSRQYFIDLAGRLGLLITIDELQPFYVGLFGCGDPVGEIDWKFVWQVNAPAAAGAAQRQQLECSFNSLKPAQTLIIFKYE